jgi:hypothetical protein
MTDRLPWVNRLRDRIALPIAPKNLKFLACLVAEKILDRVEDWAGVGFTATRSSGRRTAK